ncbi:hypothetical protein CCR94_08685 [Rhodoblastus sphagnicola]|uniref:GYF domain-containing protein n=1 Tax=Rhodoblastus sphagnicola TaxID=333368 RepID=A0A2S6NAA9_9HYPH|nr:DUF4339 domain-containing protein [Rhodoblastus sphagnicola]MBB4198188.1 hypothetical protein [Rhodoblastus sphagnicola]PPQ31553.1 hypothetical protein CCR94_08685 [Rhodoblastus sphagnicola]
MTWNHYFKDRTGAQNGPVSFEELLIVARAGRIAPDCLVWPEGGEPRPARDIPELAAAINAPAGGSPLRGDFPVWNLFWRSLVTGFGFFLVVPAPWLGLWFYRWLAGRISLPNGRRLALESAFATPAVLFLGLALSIVAPAVYAGIVAAGDPGAAERADVATIRLVASAVEFACSFLILRWFVGALRSEDGALDISFRGGFWAFFGWNLALGLSILTIVGWAWVARYMARWTCRNIAGSHSFEFVGEGVEILWRTLVVVFGSLLIIPIPWLVAWYYTWFVAQIVTAPRGAA